MPEIKCFWVEPTGRVFVERSACSDTKANECQVRRWHEAVYHREMRDVGLPLWDDDGKSDFGDFPDVPLPEGDVECDLCGGMFAPKWRGGSIRAEYKRADTGEICNVKNLHELPAGAMWDAAWLRDFLKASARYRRGADGIMLSVMTPGGEWHVDGPASNGPKDAPGWTRTGTVPNITATPSIMCGNYHGWLRNGVLVDA